MTITNALRRRQPRPRPTRLTGRELDVIRLMSDGLSDKEIAMELAISTHTVASYTIRIYEKLDAINRAHAVALCFRRGLLSVGQAAGDGRPE